MFIHKTKVRLFHTDEAGLLFYGAQYHLMHESVEEMLQAYGLPLRVMLCERDYKVPVVHSEADYFARLQTGDLISIKVSLERLGTTSFILGYELLKDDLTLAGKGKSVHVSINSKTGEKIPLPDELLMALSKLK